MEKSITGNGNSNIKSGAEKFSEKAAEAIQGSAQKIESATEKAKGEAENYLQQVEEYVKDSPIKSLVAAAAVGLMVGAIVAK